MRLVLCFMDYGAVLLLLAGIGAVVVARRDPFVAAMLALVLAFTVAPLLVPAFNESRHYMPSAAACAVLAGWALGRTTRPAVVRHPVLCGRPARRRRVRASRTCAFSSLGVRAWRWRTHSHFRFHRQRGRLCRCCRGTVPPAWENCAPWVAGSGGQFMERKPVSASGAQRSRNPSPACRSRCALCRSGGWRAIAARRFAYPRRPRLARGNAARRNPHRHQPSSAIGSARGD